MYYVLASDGSIIRLREDTTVWRVEVDAIEIRRRLFPRIPSKIVQLLRRYLFFDPPHILDYRYEDLLAERELLATAQKTRPDVVHVLYGDEQLDYLLRSDQSLGCPLVVSFHLPTQRAAARLNFLDKKRLSRIDAVILLTTYQLHDYQKWFAPERLFYVPHGIDTDRFLPGERQSNRKEIQLLTVGSHMRDWEVLAKIIQHIENRQLPVQVDVVGGGKNRDFLKGFKSVRLLSNIGEDDLITLYQNADALLLPVTSATANNSALESLACGTPVISNAIEGMPDYIDSGGGWLFPKGEVNEVVNLVEKAVSDRTIFEALRHGARLKALEFSWTKVSGQAREVYLKAIQNYKA